MSPNTLALLVFVAAALSVVGGYLLLTDLFLRDNTRLNRRVNEVLRSQQREQIKRSPLFRNLDQPVTHETIEEKQTWWSTYCLYVEQSGLKTSPQRLLAKMAISGAVAGLIVGLLRQSLIVAVLVGTAVASLFVFDMLYRRNSKMRVMLEQLPDAFDLMGRILRAGQSVSNSLLAVAEECEQPIAGEFAYCYEQQNLGLSPEIALRDLCRRTGLLEVKILTLALLVQQETGGNLADLLDKLANVVRERIRVRGRIKSLTAEGRLQAVILMALPVLMLILLASLNSTYAKVISEHPGVIGAMFAVESLGALWIWKIVHFDF